MEEKNLVLKVRAELNLINDIVKVFVECESEYIVNCMFEKIQGKFQTYFNRVDNIEKKINSKECTLMDMFFCKKESENIIKESKKFIVKVYNVFEEGLDVKSKEIINEVEKTYISLNCYIENEENPRNLNIVSLDYFMGIKEIGERWDNHIEKIEKVLGKEIVDIYAKLYRKIEKIIGKIEDLEFTEKERRII